MATLQDLMNGLKNQRERASEKSPVADALNKTMTGMKQVSTAIDKLQLAVRDQMAANMVAKKAGNSDDVNTTIRSMLKAKVAEDQLESERHKRMMDIAEELVPKVTEEQLKAFRMQQLVAREHKKTLEATIEIEEKKAAIQKKNEEEIAKRRIAVIEKERAQANFDAQDKYGTIESAIGGLGGKAQDTLSKFLVDGLNRFVKERKETPVVQNIKETYDAKVDRQNNIANNRKAQIDKVLGTKKEDINEEFSIRAAKYGISNPGSAAKLYMDRESQVSSLAREGESLEKSLVSGRAKFSSPRMESAIQDVAKAIRGEAPEKKAPAAKVTKKEEPEIVPTLPKGHIEDFVNETTRPMTAPQAKVLDDVPRHTIVPDVEPESKPEAQTTAKPAPKNARFERAKVQRTRPSGPATKRSAPLAPVQSPASTGMFGSKSGAVNFGGITKALGGIVSKLGTIASSAVKFLGPWALVANSIMAFDRLVPIVSDLAGAIMDMSKLIMPLIVSSIIETGAQILGGINGLINLFDHAKLIGPHWTDKNPEVQQALSQEREKEAERQSKLQKAKKESAQGGVVIDTTSARRGAVVGTATVTRREMALTPPSEENAIKEQARVAQAPAPTPYQAADWQQQKEQNQALRESVIAASHNPGTTPIMVANPALAPWAV